MDGAGGPLGIAVVAANVHDAKCLAEALEAIVVERPQGETQHLCLDKGYDNPSGRAAAEAAEYVPHIRSIGEEKERKQKDKAYRPRRWVVERTLAWLQKCRGILVRYEKKWQNYLGLIQLACALLWYRRLFRLTTF